MPGNTGHVQTASDVARMERLAAAEARASKVKQKRSPEAMVTKLAAMSDAAEQRNGMRKNERKRDILKTEQRQQLSNHKAGKVSKRPAGKVCKKTPEGEEVLSLLLLLGLSFLLLGLIRVINTGREDASPHCCCGCCFCCCCSHLYDSILAGPSHLCE
ncbi:unnamed protein product [Polarella glacialis]|uniref:Uncharacterized protein n=1 Tax=Polarella glacialis TaxID=89957 RepID=A0A813ESW4_POLGL|nr:unnamed protein product [Polarella glacialis]